MYEIIIARTNRLYQASNVGELRQIVESVLDLDKLPANYHVWSNSRCITYLVQAGYIVPYSGPDWFMELRLPTPPADVPSEQPKNTHARAEYIQDDGTVSLDGQIRFSFWRSRNHVRIVFKDSRKIYGEIFVTEDSARSMWTALGRMLGFDPAVLLGAIYELEPAQIHTPEIPPERIRRPNAEFDIFKAINQMDLDMDFGHKDLPDGDEKI